MASEIQMSKPFGVEGPSYDDATISFPSRTANTDWKSKYYEATDLLAETKAELDEFQTASKELEEELERELQRTELEKERLRVKANKAEREGDDWKDKFVNLQTTHNVVTNSLQRDLDISRQDFHKVKVQMRELEMGNDDLERNERVVASTLADLEAKYSKVLEEKILLEHELLDKANLEEAIQRLKDELRDSNEETIKLKQRLHVLQEDRSQVPSVSPKDRHIADVAPSESSSSLPLSQSSPSSSELRLSDLDGPKRPRTSNDLTPVTFIRSKVIKDHLQKMAGASPVYSSQVQPTMAISRSNTISTLPHGTLPRRNPLPALLTMERAASPSKRSTSSVSNYSAVSKSRGVQMVSEMRARVRNLELKIHSRVPRLRMGSMSRSAAPSPRTVLIPGGYDNNMHYATPTQEKPDNPRSSTDAISRSSNESRDRQGAESPGWVLIMEETPVRKDSRTVSDEMVQRDASSPSLAPSAFRVSMDENPLEPSPSRPQHSEKSTSRPPSRLAVSTVGGLLRASHPHALQPHPRPATPTFLPVPSRGIDDGSRLKIHLAKDATSQRRSSLDRASQFSKSTYANVPASSTSGVHRRDSGPFVKSTRRQSGETSNASRRLSGSRVTSASGRYSTTAVHTKQNIDSDIDDLLVRPESRSSAISSSSKSNFGTAAASFLSRSRISKPPKRHSSDLPLPSQTMEGTRVYPRSEAVLKR